jgi:hypothetical protein
MVVSIFINNLNLGIFKNINITERVRLQFRTELFNALNHPNTGVGFIINNVTPDFFIEDAGSTFNRLDEMEFARRAIQFGLKIIFYACGIKRLKAGEPSPDSPAFLCPKNSLRGNTSPVAGDYTLEDRIYSVHTIPKAVRGWRGGA